MKKGVVFIVITVCFMVGVINGQRPADKIPYTVFDDFETGELFGWEPYPYAQDIGSNRLYFARSTPTYNNSKYALAGLVRANDAVELYNGFTKRVNLWTTNDTKVRVAVYLQSDRNPAILELSLGTFAGRQYLDTIRNPVANQWLELDIPINAFRNEGRPLTSNEHIQVVTLKATYPMVYWLNTYTMLMDEFSINGETERRFIAKSPASTDLDMFGISILNKHFFFGDNISLSVAPQGNIALQNVRGTLVDGKGRVVKDNIPFSNKNNEWVNEAIYKPTKGDATGQWEIRLSGQGDKGIEIKWGFKFLMAGKPITGYPRLFFSGAELQHKLTNEKSAVAKRILNRALENTDFMRVNVDAINEKVDRTRENLVGGPYAKYSAGLTAFDDWQNPMKALQDVIQEGSFRYAFTGDTTAGNQAKKAVLKLCSFSKWNNNWMLERKFWTYYPVGYVLTQVAYGYDMLHDLFTDSERKFIRNAIMEKGLKLFNRDMVEMNRMPSNITNHIAVLVSGSLLAATAIYGEDKDNLYMEPYLSGIITKAKTFIDRTYYEDGSYAEPKTGYMNMATRAIVELMATLERNFGVDYSTTTHAGNFYKYPLQATDSKGTMQDFGDGNSSYKAFTEIHSEWFVYRTGNPLLYNFVKPYWEAGNGGYFGYLWYRDDIKPVSRENLPTSRIFGAQGMVMRSGWKDESTIISTRVGPHGNHAHFDQGSFQVMANGEQLLTDAGIGAGGYYKNLEYLVYNVQAIAHNVMLIDYDPESQAPADFDNGIAALRSWPRMVHSFAGELADAVESDLSSVYKGKLSSYTRTLLYTKTGPLFLFDKVKANAAEGHTFNWVFHAPQKGLLNALPNYTGWFDKKEAGTSTINPAKQRDEANESTFSYSDQRLKINRAKARLTLDVISPVIETSTTNDKPFESYILLNGKPKQTAANFLAVILPQIKPLNGNYDPAPVITRVSMPGWIGAKVEQVDAVDLGFFRTEANTNADSIAGFFTDAERFTASFNKTGKLLKAYFEGRFFSGSGFSVKSNTHISCAISAAALLTNMEINSAENTELEVLYTGRPSKLLLNGVAFTDWRYDPRTKRLVIKIPAGRNDLLIR